MSPIFMDSNSPTLSGFPFKQKMLARFLVNLTPGHFSLLGIG